MNQLYPSFTWAAVGGRVAFAGASLICALMPRGFEFDPQHTSLADVRGQIIAAAPMKHWMNGDYLDAENALFQGVKSDRKVGSLVLFVAANKPESSPLLAFMDVVHGFPMMDLSDGLVTSVCWDNRPPFIANLGEVQ